jgi:putative iron-regulated protein
MNGPIDNTNGPEGNLNAWPLDEAYVDYMYDVATHSKVNNGLIADSTFEINTTNLRSVNEDGGETYISIGYHALEFLLWGQDLNYDPVSNSSNNFDAAGQRTYSDYLTERFADRRKKYLNVTAQILVDDLTYLVNAWKKDAWGETAFLSKSPDQALTEIMTGMAMLSKGELAGERMFVAVNNRDQEDEHSCFSDNTHRDIYTNALGIKNVYLGSYGSILGASIQDLLKNQNKELEEKLSAQFNSTWETIEAVNTHAPFDAQLLEETVTGSGVIMTAVLALQKQGDRLVEAAAELGLKRSADLEE